MDTFLKQGAELAGLLRASQPFTQAQVATDDNGVLTVQGPLVSYGIRNDHGYLHVPGAAQAALAERKQAGRSIPMGYQHSPFAPLTVIGKWSDWTDSRTGIYGSGRISDVQAGRDAATLLQDQAIDGISIGFNAVDDDPDVDTVQLLAPGQTGIWDTPYGRFEYTAPDWTLCFSEIEIVEASIVSAPADDTARVDRLLQTSLAQAAIAMPGLVQSESWEDVAYSMALLMGGRGAGAFTDLPDIQHFALYQRLAAAYRQHEKTPPAYARQPEYQAVAFEHDERELFADRYLRKTAATVTATARGIQGQLSPETREVVNQARTALDAVVQTNGLAGELHQLARRLEDATHSLQGDTPS